MTALPGGPADKAGNQYEHWWTAYRIADLLEGQASRIRLEPPASAGTGIEFEIDQDGITWVEQTKDAQGSGSWTLNRLVREGVIDAIRGQVSDRKSFRLIVSTAAEELDNLSSRARSARTIAEFAEVLTGPLKASLENLADKWEMTVSATWEFLKFVFVEHHSRSSLRRLTSSTYKLLVASDPDVVVAELRRYCDDHMHVDLTGPQIWLHLKKMGFRRRLLVGDTNTLNRLHSTLNRQQRRVSFAAPQRGIAPRGETDRLADRLKSPDCHQVVVVDGVAGVGKSTVVSEVATMLEAEGWFVAVARMDSLDSATTSSNQLGMAIGLPESPTVLLASVSQGLPAILVIDQLDAVSAYSGRMPDVFDAVAEMLDEIAATPNVRVLLVARTVDIDNDPRLRQIAADTARVENVTIGKLTVAEVESFLANQGMTIPTSALTLELLRTPLNLAVFTRLSVSARELTYRTLQDLYHEYTREVRREVGLKVGSLDWTGITGTLITHMSNHEVLTAPTAILDPASPLEVGALESASVLIRDGARIGFFHESYFDFLFARSFVSSGRNLHAFLAASGQYLFRRAQTRQILEHLVATDRANFRRIAAELLTSPEIRRHLQDIVVTVLTQVDATADDWAALDGVAWGDSPMALKVRVLLTRPAWFDAADALGRWEDWLADPTRVEEAFHKLVFAARERPARAEQLVRPYADSSEWRIRFLFLIQWSLSPKLTDLAIELVERGHLDDARGPVAVNSDFWSIVYGLKQDDAISATRLTGAYLRRGLARARAEGFMDPFMKHLSTYRSAGGASVITELAHEVPEAFLTEVLPFVVEVALADQYLQDDQLPASRRWGYRHLGGHGVHDAVFSGVDNALRELAGANPALCVQLLEGLREAESFELRFLTCRAMEKLGRPDEAVEWLLSDHRNLELGWADSPRWASRELVRVSSPTCSDLLYRRLEEVLLAHKPRWESRSSRGRSQYELLGAVEPSRLSEPARRRLSELERRFGAQPQGPKVIEAHFVGSPIGDDSSKHMSDENWLKALRKHSKDVTDWSRRIPVGGAQELAQVLGRRAKEDPQRFTALALRFDDSIPAEAMDAIIRNVTGATDVDTLTQLCEHASHLHGSAVGRSICSAVQHAGAGNGRLVALIEKYAKDEDPDHESARTAAGSGEFFYGGDLYMAGINSTRGEAALATASLLFASDEYLDRLLPVVQKLATDPILAVRVCTAEAVVALLNYDPDEALDVAQRLLDPSLDVLDARSSERLLIYAIIRDPNRFESTLSRALHQGTDAVAKVAGLVWAVAVLRDVKLPALPDDVEALPDAARLGAAALVASNPAGAFELLTSLLDDSNSEVRAEAARAMGRLDLVPYDDIDSLIEAFLSSAAFDDHCEHLLDSLEQLNSVLPASAINVCERAVKILGHDLGNVATSSSLVATDVITIVLRLYRQGDTAMRVRCLDVIDRLTETNAYGLVEALESER